MMQVDTESPQATDFQRAVGDPAPPELVLCVSWESGIDEFFDIDAVERTLGHPLDEAVDAKAGWGACDKQQVATPRGDKVRQPVEETVRRCCR
jgi:hypothetical protein